MKRFSEQFHTKSKSVKLSAAEKTELRERLLSYMEYHPLPAELKSQKAQPGLQKSPLLQEAFTTVSIPFSFLFRSVAAVAVFMLVVVPFVAERAVPGDTLYAVKVQFNEEIRSTLTFDSVQKVEWETERMNRRIAEARLLASEGRLTEEVEAEVAMAVRTHSQNAQKEIALLREQDAEEATMASIAFDSTLEAQATSLKDDEVEQSDTAETKKMPNLIADAVDESRALNEQPNASSTPSYEKLMARVEINTTRMYELSASLDESDPEVVADVARRIQDIERSITEAIEKSNDSQDESRAILVDVLKRAQKLIVFMTDLDVSESVDIEELVPVVLTNEEQVTKTAEFKKVLSEKKVQIQALVSDMTTNDKRDLVEKIEAGLVQIDELVAGFDTSENFKAVQTLATEAIEIANDSLLVLEKNGVKPVPVVPENTVEEISTSTASSTIEEGEEVAVEEVPAATTSTSSIDAQ